MYCPVCKETRLEMTERQGVEIDYCPECRGVWLDRGELDKIIERSAFRRRRTVTTSRAITVREVLINYSTVNESVFVGRTLVRHCNGL